MRLLTLPNEVNQSNSILEYGPYMHPSVWIYHVHMYTNSSDSASPCQSHLPMGPLTIFVLGTDIKTASIFVLGIDIKTASIFVLDKI